MEALIWLVLWLLVFGGIVHNLIIRVGDYKFVKRKDCHRKSDESLALGAIYDNIGGMIIALDCLLIGTVTVYFRYIIDERAPMWISAAILVGLLLIPVITLVDLIRKRYNHKDFIKWIRIEDETRSK
jgi:predicted permease